MPTSDVDFAKRQIPSLVMSGDFAMARYLSAGISASVIMAVALIPYFAFRELGRVIGRERLRTLLFRGKQDAKEYRDGRSRDKD